LLLEESVILNRLYTVNQSIVQKFVQFLKTSLKKSSFCLYESVHHPVAADL